MELNLNKKVVLITGASKGIGLEAARYFGQEGCKVAICARGAEELKNAALQLADEGIEVYSQPVDVTRTEQMKSFANSVLALWGSIDIWINNAGIPVHQPMTEISDELWDLIIATNLTAVYQGCKLAASAMKANGGVILNAGSFQTHFPAAGSGPYGATKAGVASLTRAFAGELASRHIRVITYIPGVIETPMANVDDWINHTDQLQNIPMKRTGKPEEIAKTLVFLASDAASYINGVSVEITGGKFCVQNPMYSWEQ